MSDIRRIGICTGGGDAPGLNAVIRAAVKSAILKYHWQVIGIPDGFDGLIWPEKSRPLTLKDVSGILPRGGTILGTTNRGNPFHYCTIENGVEVVRDISDEVIAHSRQLGIDAVISIGGDGSQKIALALFKKGMNIVGVPKTIDNDLSATEVTFGFDTALVTATDAVDKIHTTAESHHRIMVVEVMGRDAGWIALEAGIAGGAHVILIPEIPFTIQKICAHVALRESYGKRFTGRHQAARGMDGKPPHRLSRQSDRRFCCHGYEERRAGQRVGAHPARRFTDPVRPHPGHSFRRGRGRSDRRGRIRQNGLFAQCPNRSGEYCRRRRPIENRGPSRTNREHRPRDWDQLRRLRVHPLILSPLGHPQFTPSSLSSLCHPEQSEGSMHFACSAKPYALHRR